MKNLGLKNIALRAVVFLLAAMSFACLLGQFYGFWNMRAFACWVFPPAGALLAVMAVCDRTKPRAGPAIWIVQGAVAGVVAAVAYDLYRLPFVLDGAPLFIVFPKFGQSLLGGGAPDWLAQAVGWTYHFSNGAALGIMFLSLVQPARPRVTVFGAILFALTVEGILLLTPYASYFNLSLNARFLFLTASAHFVFGVALGLWCWRRVPGKTVAAA